MGRADHARHVTRVQKVSDISYAFFHGNGFELLPPHQAVIPIIGTVLSGPVFHLRRCDKGMLAAVY